MAYWFCDESRIFSIEAILQAACMRRNVLFTIFKYLFLLQRYRRFQNMQISQGIAACRHFLDTRDRNSSIVGIETLCDLIRMILTMNNFIFNDKHYLQIHGTAMEFETDVLSRVPYQPHAHT